MSVVMGVHPGGRSSFALCGLFWSGKLPALFFTSRSYSNVQQVLDDIVGVAGEWGPIVGIAVDAPLTWATSSGGVRACDRKLRARVPKWVPSSWVRAPNAQPGAATIQGPALVWSLAKEAKRGLLPLPAFYEGHARASLARVAPDLQEAVLGYRQRGVDAATRRKYVEQLVERTIDPGIIKLEAPRPTTAGELDALICAITALGTAHPESGLLIRELPGDTIRPVGKRSMHIIDALP